MCKRRLHLLSIATAFGIAILASSCYAESDHMEVVTKFFEVLAEKQSGPAIEYAFGTNPGAVDLEDQIAEIKLQYATVEPLLGELRGYDVFVSEVVFDRYAYVLAMAAYETQPLKFEFVLYRPGQKWLLQNFMLDTEFTEEIKTFAFSELCE